MPQVGFVIRGQDVLYEDALALARDNKIPYPPALLRVLFNKRQDQSPTPSALGGCLRRFELQRQHGYFVAPEKGLAAAYGTAFHDALDHAATDEAGVQEERLTAWVDLPGLPEGFNRLPMPGKPDHVDEAESLVMDWKNKNYVGKTFQPQPEHIRQVSVYAWLYWKVKGVRLQRWRIVYIAPNMSPAVVAPFEGDLPPMQEVENWIRLRLRLWASPVSRGDLPYPQDSFFEDEPKKQGLCNWCPVRAHCEAAWEGGR